MGTDTFFLLSWSLEVQVQGSGEGSIPSLRAFWWCPNVVESELTLGLTFEGTNPIMEAPPA